MRNLHATLSVAHATRVRFGSKSVALGARHFLVPRCNVVSCRVNFDGRIQCWKNSRQGTFEADEKICEIHIHYRSADASDR